MRYYRIEEDDGPRLVVREGSKAYDLTAVDPGIDSFRALAAASAIAGEDPDSIAEDLLSDARLVDAETVADARVLPTVPDEVWAAGVTYEVSNDARGTESGRSELYQHAFEAERPEVFFKATPSRTVGPGDAVGIRADSNWDVPEPELGVVLRHGEIVGYTIGNDMSSRDIEGESPLYLPQAKVFERCCSLGPAIASPGTVGDPRDLELSMRIERDGEVMFDDATSTSWMARSCEELVSYLNRHNAVPEIAVLLTGTSLVPEEFTLEEGDDIEIGIENIGTLENSVVRV